MLGKCFSVLCVISFVFAAFCGNMRELSQSIISGCEKSVNLVISITGIMVLWNGIMELLKSYGIIKHLSRLLSPFLKFVFPRSFSENSAKEEITACISANMLGISNSATPLGILAIEKMNTGRKSVYATNDMITLCAISSSSFCLIPTTIIAVRQGCGALITYEIIPVVWITSFCCMIFSIIISRLLGRIYGDC